MSFEQCLLTAVQSGALSSQRAQDGIAEYQRVKQSMLASGKTEVTAEYAASHEAVNAMTTLNAAKRWERINDLRAQQRLFDRMSATDAPAVTLRSISQEAAEVYESTLGRLHSMSRELLFKYSPKLAGIREPTDNMDNVVRALYGDVTNAEAKRLADGVADLQETMRKMLNEKGANVPENPNRRLPQNHSRDLLRNVGRAKWVSDHLQDDVLDWDIMQYQGRKILPSERAQVLETVYDAIITNGWERINPAFGNTQHLSSRLSRERFLYYKTADSWLKMQSEYGDGNFFHQFAHQMDSTALNVALMHTYGPNPHAGREFLQRTATRRWGELIREATDAGQSRRAGRLEAEQDKSTRQFREEYALLAREVDTGSGDALAMTMATARTWSATKLLGGAIVSSLSDPVFQMFSRNAMGLPYMRTIPQYFDALRRYPNFRQQVIDNGIKWETLTNRAYEGTRYNLALEGANFARKLSDVNYRLQGLSAWTQVGRGVMGLEIADAFAKSAHLPFDQVPYRHLLEAYNISETEWNMFRSIPRYTPDYYSFGRGDMLRPIDFLNGAQTAAERDAATKFMAFQEHMVRSGIPHTTLEVRAKMGEALPAKQPLTQFVKSMTQLMTFPVVTHYQYWRQILAQPSRGRQAWMAMKFMMYTTASGAMISQIKDVLNGKELHPMDTKEFWFRAMMLGGAGGIIGDMLFQGTLLGSPYQANTPLGQDLENLKRLFVDNAADWHEGKDLHLGADLARTTWGLFPIKPLGVKLAVERGIMDELLLESDPAAYNRKVRAQQEWENDQGQGTWWGVGD